MYVLDFLVLAGFQLDVIWGVLKHSKPVEAN